MTSYEGSGARGEGRLHEKWVNNVSIFAFPVLLINGAWIATFKIKELEARS